jgi:ankyrin repeat protein
MTFPRPLQNRILTEAAHNGHEEIVRTSLDNGAGPNCHESSYGCNYPLNFAVSRGYMSIIQLLLSRGAKRQSVGRYTTLFIAATKGYKEVVQLLLGYGTDINPKTKTPPAAAAQ